MLGVTRNLIFSNYGRIVQHQATRCGHSESRRSPHFGTQSFVTRSMSSEGQAAQKSVQSGYRWLHGQNIACMQTRHLVRVRAYVYRQCRAPQKAEQGEETLFDKIVAKQIPATILYEDDTALAFK